jgi:hypothetical protein
MQPTVYLRYTVGCMRQKSYKSYKYLVYKIDESIILLNNAPLKIVLETNNKR